jgi:type III secretion system (T3SS) SseB-like protein
MKVPFESIRQSELKFLSEQDGQPEKLLKSRLVTEVFIQGDVQRAYLVRVEYDDGLRGVALCISPDCSNRDQLVQEIGAIFSELFHNHAQLDILFLTPEREMRVIKVSKPFFVR